MSLDWLNSPAPAPKKSSEKTESKKTPTPKKESSSKNKIERQVRYTNNLSKQLKSFGKVFHIDEMQDILNWLMTNKNDLYTAVDQYLRTYTNPKRTVKEGGITDKRNKRLQQIKEDLENFPSKNLKPKY